MADVVVCYLAVLDAVNVDCCAVFSDVERVVVEEDVCWVVCVCGVLHGECIAACIVREELVVADFSVVALFAVEAACCEEGVVFSKPVGSVQE